MATATRARVRIDRFTWKDGDLQIVKQGKPLRHRRAEGMKKARKRGTKRGGGRRSAAGRG